ncbi:MAG: hypothetical protein R3358_03520 [Woeseiaceae bacterium]|nr:hypothetical protein [Woeseiaceae bacterium]
MKRATTLLAVAIVLGACSQDAPAPATDEAAPADAVSEAPAAPDSGIYAAAVANENRPTGDYERDANRKPAEVLAFLGIRPGMHVLDMFSGGGYYTELLSLVVGDAGRVTAHTNKAYVDFVGEEFEARYANDRLPNVDVLWAENNELDLEPGQYDAIMLVLSYHDIYFTPDNVNWPKIDGPKLLAELHEGLRDDGFIGLVDHAALPGSGQETGNTVHRIDRDLVVAEMAAAGFVLDAESDLLRNPDDDRSLSAFDPSIRGKTDRFVLRFRKAPATD